MSDTHHLDICLSPLQYDIYHRDGNLVVLVDVIRATTVFSTALYHGAEQIIAVKAIEQALSYGKKGFLTAGERNSYKLEGFDLGNSPLEYCSNKIAGKSIAITTTNGTQALGVVPQGTDVVTGAWVNKTALINYLTSCNRDILLLCSGWKFANCIEDTLYAGQIAQELLNINFHATSDSVQIAMLTAKAAKNRELEFILDHSPRLKSKYATLKNDLEYSLKTDIAPIVPTLVNGSFIELR